MTLRRLIARTAIVVMLMVVVGGTIAYVRSTNDCDTRAAISPTVPMQAYGYCDYGTADVLRLHTVERPVPKAGEVLVRVQAAAVNPLDWHMLRGTPYVMRLDSGLRKPAVTQVGVDFAGTVAAVGAGVTRFAPGDDVFGMRTGAFAEYIAVHAERALARKPTNLTFEQAAAVPVAAFTALQGLRDHGRLQRGQSVLINGASGGVGTFAVQIASHLGAEVTGVCSTRNVALVKALGAARVIDYTREDFTAGAKRYDVVLDNVGNQPLSAIRRVLAPDGRYILVGGGGPDDHTVIGPLGRVAAAFLLSRFGRQEMTMFVARGNRTDLEYLGALLQAGTIVPVIDRTYPLAQLPEAIRYLEKGRARGKVVITVE